MAPERSAEVIARVSGEVELLRLEDGTPVEEGLRVQRGDILAMVERRHLGATLREVEAALEEARSALKVSEIRKEDAEREKNRMVALYERGSVTEQHRDQAVTAFQSAQAGFGLAQRQVARAEAALESARLRYEDATKKAPIIRSTCSRFSRSSLSSAW